MFRKSDGRRVLETVRFGLMIGECLFEAVEVEVTLKEVEVGRRVLEVARDIN